MIWTDDLAGLKVRPSNRTMIVTLYVTPLWIPRDLELDHGQARLVADALDNQGTQRFHTVQGEQFSVGWYIDHMAGRIRLEVRGEDGFWKKIFPKTGKRMAEAIRSCLAYAAVSPEDRRRDDGLRRIFN